MLDFLTGSDAVKLMDQIGRPFKKLPHLPKGLVSFFVSISPWLALIGGILGILGAMTTFLGGSAIYQMSWAMAGVGSGYSTYVIVAAVFSLIMSALLLMAFKPLKEKKSAGWAYLFWSEVVSVVQSVAGLVFGMSGIVGILISVAIGFYLLYELKASYK